MIVTSLKRCQMSWVNFETIKNIPTQFNFQLTSKCREGASNTRYLHIWGDSPVDSEQEVADGDGDWIPDWADLNSVKFQYSKTFICRKDTSHWHCSSFSSLSWLPWTPNSVRFRISLQRVVKGRNLEQKGRIFFLWLLHQVKVYIGQIIVISTFSRWTTLSSEYWKPRRPTLKVESYISKWNHDQTTNYVD